MRKTLLMLLLCFPSTSPAQTADSTARCKDLVITQMDAARNRKRPFRLDLESGAGTRLVYFGVLHSFDPADKQWPAMTAAWDSLVPTTAFYEGPGGSVSDSADAAVRARANRASCAFWLERAAYRRARSSHRAPRRWSICSVSSSPTSS